MYKMCVYHRISKHEQIAEKRGDSETRDSSRNVV